MTPPPHLSRLDAVRVALLHTLSPTQQWELASRIAVGVCNLPLDEAGLRNLDLNFRGRKRGYLAALPPEWEMEPELAKWEARGWRFLTAHDDRFPRELWEIPDPPLHLFVEGTLALAEDDRPRVAIVGSRVASAAGTRMARELARDLALADCVVVSGLARGIDGAAHRGALSAGGDTLAVLGTGLDRVYPDEHREMAREISAQGLLVTEFAPGTPPLPLHFPRRNRILVGLADALVVVEGGERSGARSSVDHALDQGREVFAVPRDPLHEGSRLPNRLLRDGATPLVSARDVLDFFEGNSAWRRSRRIAGARMRSQAAPSPPVRRDSDSRDESAASRPPAVWSAAQALGSPEVLSTPRAPDSLHQSVRALVERLPGRSFEAISAELRPAQPHELLGVLTTLELEGRLRRLPGGRWFPASTTRARA